MLDRLNNRLFKKLSGSRRSIYELLDKPALKPLPATAYQYAQWKKAKVHIDYHVEVNRHYYSVPRQLVSKKLDIRYTERTVECFHKGQRVVSHPFWPSNCPAFTRSTPSRPPKESPTEYTKSARLRPSWPRGS
ncbi:hypothetical protein DFAR_3960003 [Desulfarculales bacterium]